MSKAKLTQPNSTAAPSGPSASKSHGTGAGPKMPTVGPARMPNKTIVTESLGTATPPKQDHPNQ